jgi:hypothetical protein
LTAILPHRLCLFLHLDSGLDDSRNQKELEFLEYVAVNTNCPLRRVSSKWIDHSELKELMVGLKQDATDGGRRILLVSGSHLEDQVTVCTLEALLEGFDVHLLCDFISTQDVNLKPVLLVRLIQAGAVPSSLRQFLYMWLVAETDLSMTQHLRQFIEDYDATFLVRPA